jgi:hypothetical protein
MTKISPNLACAIVTMIGIYGCDTDPGITHPGTRCYKIATGAAITEWILAVCFVNYLFALGFTSFHGESIRDDMLKSARLAEAMKHLDVSKGPKKTFWTALGHFFF